MTDRAWAGRVGDPFAQEEDVGGYQPWRISAAGWVRDLKFVPAPGSGEMVRYEPYMQAISLEMNENETQICLMCHTSGQLIFIQGQGLGQLAEQISAKRVQSVHVWHESLSPEKPPVFVTAVRFEKVFSHPREDNST